MRTHLVANTEYGQLSLCCCSVHQPRSVSRLLVLFICVLLMMDPLCPQHTHTHILSVSLVHSPGWICFR